MPAPGRVRKERSRITRGTWLRRHFCLRSPGAAPSHIALDGNAADIVATLSLLGRGGSVLVSDGRGSARACRFFRERRPARKAYHYGSTMSAGLGLPPSAAGGAGADVALGLRAALNRLRVRMTKKSHHVPSAIACRKSASRLLGRVQEREPRASFNSRRAAACGNSRSKRADRPRLPADRGKLTQLGHIAKRWSSV